MPSTRYRIVFAPGKRMRASAKEAIEEMVSAIVMLTEDTSKLLNK